jgi:hypothetical protein
MKRFLLFLLAACLLSGAVSAAPKAPKGRGKKTGSAEALGPVRRVRDALAELGFSFFPDEDDENLLRVVFEEERLFRGRIQFRLAYHPDADLLQAQGILLEEDLVAENLPRAFEFASQRGMETFFPKVMVATNVPGGALVTEWNWKPLGGMTDGALETNLAVFVSATFGTIEAAIEENIYPSSLAVPGTEGDEDDLADSLEAVFR